jgi:hypothetical protein
MSDAGYINNHIPLPIFDVTIPQPVVSMGEVEPISSIEVVEYRNVMRRRVIFPESPELWGDIDYSPGVYNPVMRGRVYGLLSPFPAPSPIGAQEIPDRRRQ